MQNVMTLPFANVLDSSKFYQPPFSLDTLFMAYIIIAETMSDNETPITNHTSIYFTSDFGFSGVNNPAKTNTKTPKIPINNNKLIIVSYKLILIHPLDK